MAQHFGVGLNDNVYLENAVLDDKLWVTVTFGQKQETEYNAFEALMADEVVDKPKTTIEVKLFNLKVPKAEDNKGNKRTEAQMVEMITRDVNKLKAVFIHIASGYLTKENRKFDVYRATGIDANNFNQLIQTQGVLDQITKNLATDFINMMKPFFGNQDQLFRLKLIRQSKDKHFPTLADSYLDENPFWESMEISKEASKVKFSKYELDNNLNDPTPSSKSSSDKPPAGEEQAPVSAESVFGQ